MRVKVEFSSTEEIKKFTEAVKSINCDVRLIGKDENGNEWNLSAKSLFCSLIISEKLQKHREHTAHDVDWNTLYCECERDIYAAISAYISE